MAGAPELIATTKAHLLDAAGGPARLQVIAVLGAVLGLGLAELGTVAAVSDQLEAAFHIGNMQIGLLLAAAAFIRAVTTLPVGSLADRVSRRRLLMTAASVWALAMLASAAATSYGFLLATRLVLGAATAAAWPCVASLIGDFFPARERASIYGLILSGELLGVGLGFVVAGEVSSIASWRWAYVVMALPSAAMVWAISRYLPEPRRGGQSWLAADETDAAAASRRPRRETGGGRRSRWRTSLARLVGDAQIGPRRDLVLTEDPGRWSVWRAMAYLLRIPSYTLLICASTLAYAYFAGLRAFGMIYFTRHYGLPRSLVAGLVVVLGIAALGGLLVGGKLSEWLLARGRINARIVVPAFGLFLSVPFFAGGIWLDNPWFAGLLLAAGVGGLTMAVAPIDAARLDIVHPLLWGRGEGGRMTLRAVFEGLSPLLFGWMSDWLGGGDDGLRWTFLVMLLPMLLAGFIVLPGRKTYPRDVATAAASARARNESRKSLLSNHACERLGEIT